MHHLKKQNYIFAFLATGSGEIDAKRIEEDREEEEEGEEDGEEVQEGDTSREGVFRNGTDQ